MQGWEERRGSPTQSGFEGKVENSIGLKAKGGETEKFALDFSLTHVVSLGARLNGDPVAVHGGHPVEEDEDADHRGREQPARVEAQPGEVDRDLKSK